MECAFGEIDLRWGILWCLLQFSLKTNIQVIDARMRLHNFIVDFCEEFETEGTVMGDLDKALFDEDCRRFMARHSNVGPVGVHGGEDDVCRDSDGNPLVGGRPTAVQTQTTNEDKLIRERLKNHVQSQGCVRPTVNWHRENNRMFDR